jgi:hypothetical protein
LLSSIPHPLLDMVTRPAAKHRNRLFSTIIP